jgi:enterochelin esterase family protein
MLALLLVPLALVLASLALVFAPERAARRITRPLGWCLVALLAAALLGGHLPATAAAGQQLAVGAAQAGALGAGQVLRWQPAVPPGHVVQGSFDGPGAVLDLLDAEGRHLRRLVAEDGSPQGFTWQVQPGQQLQVRGGAQAGPYSLVLRRAFAPADTAAAAPAPQSPRLRALAQTLPARRGSPSCGAARRTRAACACSAAPRATTTRCSAWAAATCGGRAFACRWARACPTASRPTCHRSRARRRTTAA